jgi:hypothetical protein
MLRPDRHQKTSTDADSSRTSPFLRVEKREENGSRHFIVHTQQPRLVVEFEERNDASDSIATPVIRRVCVPNSPIGGYRFCGSVMVSALAAIESLR